MATLYELGQGFLELLAIAEEGDTDPQMIKDTMEALEGEIEDKIEGCACVMKELDGKAAVLDREIERLTKRKEAIERNSERIKRGIEGIMRLTGNPKIKTKLFTFRIQKNTPAVVLETTDVHAIPERFWKIPEPGIDKTAIKAALKAGEKLPGIAHLEQGEGLRIE